jgi:hypothetical protein
MVPLMTRIRRRSDFTNLDHFLRLAAVPVIAIPLALIWQCTAGQRGPYAWVVSSTRDSDRAVRIAAVLAFRRKGGSFWALRPAFASHDFSVKTLPDGSKSFRHAPENQILR